MNADNADEKAKKMQILQIEIGVWNADRPITLNKTLGNKKIAQELQGIRSVRRSSLYLGLFVLCFF